MDIYEVQTIVDEMPQEFNSHKFILKYLEKCPRSYGCLLIKHEDVTAAHAEIGRFLLNKSCELRIEKSGMTGSNNIFGNIDQCAKWKKVK